MKKKYDYNVQKKFKIDSFFDLTNKMVKKIAIGGTITSPIREYSELILEDLNIYNKILDKIIYSYDANEIEKLFLEDAIDCAIVYKSRARVMSNVEIVDIYKNNEYLNVIYPIGILNLSKKNQKVQNFFNYVNSDKSKNIFMKSGFNIAE